MWILNDNDVYEMFMEKENNIYISTGSETPINEYVDGKRIYRNRMSIGNLPNATTATYTLPFTLADVTITDIRGFAKNMNFSYRYPLPFVAPAAADNIAIYIGAGGTLVVFTGSDRTLLTGVVDFYYYYN